MSAPTFFLYVLLFGLGGMQEDTPSSGKARALLEGAAAARSEIESISCEVKIFGDGAPLRHLVIAKKDDLYLFKRLNDSGELLKTILREGELFHSFEQRPNNDLEIYEIDRAVGVRGDFAFDPAVIGLTDLMAADSTVRSSLWLTGNCELEIAGQVTASSGNTVYEVLQTAGETKSRFWIEEPSFRIVRRTIDWNGGQLEIASSYADSDSILPSEVKVKRIEGSNKTSRTIQVSNVKVNQVIPGDPFVLKSMKIPLNTAAVDYRVQRIVGYWNGESLASSPSGAMEVIEAPAEKTSRFGFYSVATIATVLIGVGLVFWRVAIVRTGKNG